MFIDFCANSKGIRRMLSDKIYSYKEKFPLGYIMIKKPLKVRIKSFTLEIIIGVTFIVIFFLIWKM